MGLHNLDNYQKLKKMPKICVQSPEVVMTGDINLHAQVAVVTKAKLDAVFCQGRLQVRLSPFKFIRVCAGLWTPIGPYRPHRPLWNPIEPHRSLYSTLKIFIIAFNHSV